MELHIEKGNSILLKFRTNQRIFKVHSKSVSPVSTHSVSLFPTNLEWKYLGKGYSYDKHVQTAFLHHYSPNKKTQ